MISGSYISLCICWNGHTRCILWLHYLHIERMYRMEKQKNEEIITFIPSKERDPQIDSLPKWVFAILYVYFWRWIMYLGSPMGFGFGYKSEIICCNRKMRIILLPAVSMPYKGNWRVILSAIIPDHYSLQTWYEPVDSLPLSIWATKQIMQFLH